MPLRRPDEFTHHEAQLDGIKSTMCAKGMVRRLMLMHGWPGFWWEWYKCIRALANDSDVIAPDMRGYGDSEKPDLKRYFQIPPDVVTEDHAKLLQHLGIDRAYMVGTTIRP